MSRDQQPDSSGSTRHRRRPPWKITSVFDPDGTGGDFGYTVGLATLGHPELHMWARPTHGADPGADYILSPRDICEILDIHAEMLLHGELHVGDASVREFDAGMAEARITVGEPVHSHEVEAFGVQPGAKVLPLRWELVREPEGRSTPVSPAVAAQIERLAIEWRSLAKQLGAAVPPGRPSTDHTQRYGPWTAALDAARSAIGIVGHLGELSWCIDVLGDRHHEMCASIAIAAALARRHGRSVAFEAASSAALDDANKAITVHDSLWVDISDEEVEYLMPEARHVMSAILNALYGHMVVLEHLVGCEAIDADLSAQIHATVISVVRQVVEPVGPPWPHPDGHHPTWGDAG